MADPVEGASAATKGAGSDGIGVGTVALKRMKPTSGAVVDSHVCLNVALSLVSAPVESDAIS